MKQVQWVTPCPIPQKDYVYWWIQSFPVDKFSLQDFLWLSLSFYYKKTLES